VTWGVVLSAPRWPGWRALALGSLLARFPALRLAVVPEQLTWRPGVLMHGLAALPVTLNVSDHDSEL
jgi:hypothetical protein